MTGIYRITTCVSENKILPGEGGEKIYLSLTHFAVKILQVYSSLNSYPVHAYINKWFQWPQSCGTCSNINLDFRRIVKFNPFPGVDFVFTRTGYFYVHEEHFHIKISDVAISSRTEASLTGLFRNLDDTRARVLARK